ncbi:unnamed protein product [Arabidopsis arenosa]|uniref:Uncharacterized protein n=1 Tax=Arabidopsis arenosa TaxID=38785 RepID=A0A8S2AEF0_ARAAE|nr:unnamed protein product [Arabidopsis arenosa]
MGLRAFRQWNQSEVKTAENEGIVDAGPGDDECYPKRFKSRREKISELLFYCRVNRCIRCDHLELTIPGDDEEGEANLGCGVAGDDGVTRVDVDEDYEEAGGSKESKANRL